MIMFLFNRPHVSVLLSHHQVCISYNMYIYKMGDFIQGYSDEIIYRTQNIVLKCNRELNIFLAVPCDVPM
jgi:hypothetical protein